MWLPLGLAATLLSTGAPPEGSTTTLSYEIFRITDPDGRQSVARGDRTYTAACDVTTRKDGPKDAWSASLDLSEGFAIGTTLYRREKLTGFGLVVERPDGGSGFSWNWFDLEQGNVFTKRQGPGRVAVTVAQAA